jgi:hypothetical protein
MHTSGRLELNNNDLIVDSGSFDSVRAAILQGYGNLSAGITSAASSGKQIHVALDTALMGATQWRDQSLTRGAIVATFTYFGDVNLDGKVTGDDYTVIDANLNTTPARGIAAMAGDANMDGVVTGDDYTVVDANLAETALPVAALALGDNVDGIVTGEDSILDSNLSLAV